MRDLFADVHLFLGLVFHFAGSEDFCLNQQFDDTRWNFYQAAQFGLEAQLRWDGGQRSCSDILLDGLLQKAMDALVAHDVNPQGLEESYRILRARLETGQNGTAWQLKQLERENGDLVQMLEAYESHQALGQPVHTWS